MRTATSVFAILLSCSSCTSKGTSTGNPIVSLKVNGSSQAATVASVRFWRDFIGAILPEAVASPSSIVDSSGTTVILSQFWTTIGEVEFKPTENAESDEVDSQDVSFSGPFTADILTTAVEPIGSTSIGITQIRRIKTKLIRTQDLPGGAPAALMNKSIYISGTVNGVQFSYSTTDEAVIAVAGANPVVISGATDLLLQLKTANLFKKINLSSIVSTTDISESNRVSTVNPCPSIDASAADLYTCFRKGIESEANFGSDNGDNELDESDDTVR